MRLTNRNTQIFYLPAPAELELRHAASLKHIGFTVVASHRWHDRPPSTVAHAVAGRGSFAYAEERYPADELASCFESLSKSMAVLRGDEEQEWFTFSEMHEFIMKYGVHGLSLLNFAVTATAVPYLTRYYYAYLLGHVDDPATYRTRIEYLRVYERADDEALRRGAAEAFDHLASL